MPSKNRKEDPITSPEEDMSNPLEVEEESSEIDNSTPIDNEELLKGAMEVSGGAPQSPTAKSTKAKKKTKPKKKDNNPIGNYDDFFKKRKGIINRNFTKKSPVSKFLPAKIPAEKLEGWRKDNKDKLNERSLLNDTDTDLSTLTWLKGKYYIQLAQNTSDIKFESIVRILKTYDVPVVKSSKIVAAFDTVREANKIRKFIISKGISCSIVKFE